MRAAKFGIELESAVTNMKGVEARKWAMVDSLRQLHLDRYRASVAELIMGEARFVGERTLDVALADGGMHRISGERVFLDLGTHATVPDVPGLVAARPMTHVELLDLDRLPEHLIVMGGGYVGPELAHAMRRFGARVTVIEHGPHLAGREDADVGAALLELFRDEGITVHLQTQVRSVEGESGSDVHIVTQGPDGEGMIELVAADSDEILGFTVFGAEASELLAAVQTAMIGRVPYTALRSAIYAHPTAAEGLTFLLGSTPTAQPVSRVR